jgi:Cu/Ag efflux pump CusA
MATTPECAGERRARDIVLAASVEVRSAVVYATLMVALVFLPLFLMGGFEGGPLPAARGGVRAGDDGIARRRPHRDARHGAPPPPAAAEGHQVPRVVQALRTHYAHALERVLARPRMVRVTAVAVLLAGVAMTRSSTWSSCRNSTRRTL